jgi:hypothetical protein
MDARELARLLVEELRKQMKQQTLNNNVIAVPVFNLLSSGARGAGGTGKDIADAMQILKDAKLCDVVKLPNSGPGALKMTSEGRDLTDDEVAARIFPSRN